MKVYLWFEEEWKLVDSEEKSLFGKSFEELLKERNITIGDRATIGYRSTIGDRATIGDEATIGYRATIKENFNKDGKDIFTPEYILYQTGIVIQNGKGIFYKAVKEDLTDFHTGKYQYKIGKGDKIKLERDQSIECGVGFHFTNYQNAVAFAEKRPHKIISAEIKLDDILSVHNKIRVRAFSKVKSVNL